MKFEYPHFLYGFLLLAIPVVIHLFHFRRYKTYYFSSLRFIQQLDEASKSTQKLKHLLVLLARILAFSALILAFAQPYIPVRTKDNGGAPLLCIYIDNSFSMTQKGTEGELLSEAREQAKRLIQQADRTMRFQLVTNSLSGVEERLLTRTQVLDRIDQIQAMPLSRQQGEVISWIQDSWKKTEAEITLGTKQLALLSDFQAKTSDFSKVQADSDSYFYPIQFKGQVRSNIAVDSVWFERANLKTGTTNTVAIRLRNFGDEAVENLPVELAINESKRSIFAAVRANDTSLINISITEQSAGYKRGVVKVLDKQVHFDDDYFFAYQVQRESRVLIIQGSDASPLVERVFGLEPFFRTSVVSENNVTANDLTDQNLIILNGNNHVSSGLRSLLESFVQNGGSLAIFPGTDPKYTEFAPLLRACQLPTLQGIQSGNGKIKKLAYNDRFFEPVFEKKSDQLNLPTQTKVYRLSPANQGVALVQLQNNQPLIVRSAQPMNAYLFASSLANSFGDFTSNALFTTVLLRMGELSLRNFPLAMTWGSDAKIPLQQAVRSEQPIKFKLDQSEWIPPTSRINQTTWVGLPQVQSNQPVTAGVFAVTQEDTLGFVALNHNRLESDLTPLTAEEIQTGLAEAGIQHVSLSSIDKGQSLAQIELDKPIQYWRILLLLSLVFFLTEMALIRLWK